MAAFSLCQNNMKICISPGCEIFRIGALVGNSGGGIAFPLGMTLTETFTLAATKPKCAANILLQMTSHCSKTKMFWIPGLVRVYGLFLRWAGPNRPTF